MMPQPIGKVEVWSEIVDFRKRRRLCVFVRDPRTGQEWVAQPLIFVDCTNQLIGDDNATTNYGDELLQAMLDHAWSVGMRPAGYNPDDNSKEVAAMKAHLADLRIAAFGHTRLRDPIDEDFVVRGGDRGPAS